MSIPILFFLIFLNLPCMANDTAALNFSIRVKAEIERAFAEGQQRYDYDINKNVIKSWKDKNISAKDMESYLNAYNIAHDLERKIRLSNELKAQKYIYTDFTEHVFPVLPTLPGVPQKSN